MGLKAAGAPPRRCLCTGFRSLGAEPEQCLWGVSTVGAAQRPTAGSRGEAGTCNPVVLVGSLDSRHPSAESSGAVGWAGTTVVVGIWCWGFAAASSVLAALC